MKISALVGVGSSRSLPVGGGGAARRTTGRGGGTDGERPEGESTDAPTAGAGAPEGRPSNHTAPPATRPTAVRTASRTVEARRRGRVGIAGTAAIASVGMSASRGKIGRAHV